MADTKISALPASTTPLAGTEVLPIVQSSTTKKVSVANLTAGRSVSANDLILAAGVTSAYAKVNGSYSGVQEANKGEMAFSSGNTEFYSYGANTSTPGGYLFITRSSNASVNVNPVTISSTGLSVTGDTTVTSGNLIQGTAAKGVNFTANTGAAGMTSQLLNWYEEGTFTPDVYGTSTRGAATYAANGQVGLYTRIGNVVYITVWLSWTAHTGTGSLRVDGLPFTSKSTTSSFAFLACYNDGLTLPANAYMMGYVSPNTQIIVPQQVATGGGASGNIGMDTAATMGFTGMYFV